MNTHALVDRDGTLMMSGEDAEGARLETVESEYLRCVLSPFTTLFEPQPTRPGSALRHVAVLGQGLTAAMTALALQRIGLRVTVATVPADRSESSLLGLIPILPPAIAGLGLRSLPATPTCSSRSGPPATPTTTPRCNPRGCFDLARSTTRRRVVARCLETGSRLCSRT